MLIRSYLHRFGDKDVQSHRADLKPCEPSVISSHSEYQALIKLLDPCHSECVETPKPAACNRVNAMVRLRGVRNVKLVGAYPRFQSVILGRVFLLLFFFQNIYSCYFLHATAV